MRIGHDVIDGVRYAAVIDGKKLHALYARPDDDRPWTGDIYQGVVMRYAPSQRAYFFQIENKFEGFLPHKNGKLFSAGQKIMVRVERPESRSKGLRLSIADDDVVAMRGDDIVTQAQQDFPAIVDVSQGLQDFDRAIIALRDPVVEIQQGLNIVIEETAAFVAIDINNADANLKPYDANRLAMRELLRQMQLRNLSGQILIDCLRLQNVEHRKKILDELQTDIKNDPREIALYGFTRLGIFEMTRTRVGLSLSEIIALVN